MLRLLALSALLVAAAVEVTPASGRPAGLPNLCKVNISAPLSKLPVPKACTPDKKSSKTTTIGTFDIVHFGKQGSSLVTTHELTISLVKYANPLGVRLTKKRLQSAAGADLGPKVPVGSVAREDAGVAGVTLTAILKDNAVLMIVLINYTGGAKKNRTLANPVLLIAQAIAKVG